MLATSPPETALSRGLRAWLRVLAAALAAMAQVCPPSLAFGSEGGGDAGEEGDFDRLDRADAVQEDAIAAAMAGEWRKARDLAESALALDDSFATARARLVLVEALEHEEQFDSALYEIGRYLDLGLPADQHEQGLRIRSRIEALRARAAHRSDRRGAGLALVLAGAAPLVIGVGFVGNDVYWAEAGVPSGTWAAIGVPLVAVGVALDITGIGLLARGTRGARTWAALPSSGRPGSLGLAVGCDARGWRLEVMGRW